MPEVVWDLTTKEVLVTELVRGVSLDALENEDQELKNNVRIICLVTCDMFNVFFLWCS